MKGRGLALAAPAAALVVVVALFLLFRRDLLLCGFDPEFARSLGRDPLRFDLLLHALLGAVIALGVMTAGPLVVFGFLVLPPLAALRAAPGLVAAFALSLAFAALAFLGGFYGAWRADLPAGPVCVALAAALLVCGIAFALRRRARLRARASA